MRRDSSEYRPLINCEAANPDLRDGRGSSEPEPRGHCFSGSTVQRSISDSRVSVVGKVNAPALVLGVVDGDVDEASIVGVLDGGEDERRVGGRVLGLVDGDGYMASSRRIKRGASGERRETGFGHAERRRAGRGWETGSTERHRWRVTARRQQECDDSIDRNMVSIRLVGHAHQGAEWPHERATGKTRSRSLGDRPRERDAHSKSPESETTVVNFLSCSRVLDMVLAARAPWRVCQQELCGPRNGDADGGNADDGSSGRAYKSSAGRGRVSPAGLE